MTPEALSALKALRPSIMLQPADSEYERARKLWNGMIDKRPGLIVRAQDVDDVIAAVHHARALKALLSIRGGGHHVAGSALNDGGVVIDLSSMRATDLDASLETVRAQGGAQLQDVDHATLPRGRTVPMGVFSETGIAGLTLGGGYGWQSRARGLTCDNLVSAEIVTADAGRLRASATENSDLFWALRGGGMNLGVVTSFEYRTHPMPPELFFLFSSYPLAEARQVLGSMRDYLLTAPNELGLIAVIWTFQESDALPKQVWNRPFVGLIGTYLGSPEEGRRVLQPLRTLGTVLYDASEVASFAAVQTFFDHDYPKGRRYHWRSSYLKHLDDDAIGALIDLGARRPSALSSLDLWALGGKIADVSADQSPLAHRSAPYMVGIEANWIEPADDATNIAWAREVQAVMAPFSTGGSYVNFEDPADARRLAGIYGPNYARLLQVKATYDPSGLFGVRRG